jgi:hypothetical protein
MEAFTNFIKGLPVLAACVMASASYPPIPADLTTPVQQRIAINGPNGKLSCPSLVALLGSLDFNSGLSNLGWLEYI